MSYGTRKVERTIIIEEEEEFDEVAVPDLVNVSYITHSHNVSAEGDVGLLITNFLINTKSSVAANVVAQEQDGTFTSLYNLDLYTPVGELGDTVVLARSGFENDIERDSALEALSDHITSRRRIPQEDRELLNQAAAVLNRRRARTVNPSITLPSVRAEHGVFRNSVGTTVPVLVPPQSRPRRVQASPRATKTKRKTTTKIEESSSSSTEEEEVITTTRKEKKKVNGRR